jgi:1-deoxy-D-xylulose-5-phosphate reductoisomerase
MIFSYSNADSLHSNPKEVRRSRVCVLGSTGSVGTQTLEVIRKNRDFFSVAALSAHSNISCLIDQIREFSPAAVAIGKEEDREPLARALEESGESVRIYAGEDALNALVSDDSVEVVLNAVLGFAALPPLLAAIEAGKPVAIANKESLVAAGEIVRGALQKKNTRLVPVDSEHNAIYQAMKSRSGERPRRILITASGGPFFKYPLEDLSQVTPEQAARHPRWNMGMKISIDSASLMNKGLEVMEAAVLFGLPEHEIEVLIHPQSVLHGFVEFFDGTSVAVCYEPDMKVPILNALCECTGSTNIVADSFSRSADTHYSASGSTWLLTGESRSLEFYPVDHEKFPSILLVREALRAGGSAPLVLNAANEVAVQLFIDKKIAFTDIMAIVAKVMKETSVSGVHSYEEVLTLDRNARKKTMQVYHSFFEKQEIRRVDSC